ncbi:unnamed protein product [Camellia sinensis]
MLLHCNSLSRLALMARNCNPYYCLSLYKFRISSLSLYNSPISLHLFPKSRFKFSHNSIRDSSSTTISSSSSSASGFTWDDVFKISRSEDHSFDLHGFFDKIKICNRGSVCCRRSNMNSFRLLSGTKSSAMFITGFADHLRRFQDVFIFPQNNSFTNHVTLHPILRTPEERTRAVADVVKCLGEEFIPGIRNELYPVISSFGTQVFFSLERAAAPYFGIKAGPYSAFGVHMNGYVERAGQKYLWIGKRSEVKPTYPGMLDHLVAGGLPHDIACGENLVKECEEEAGIPSSISNEAIPVGAVSNMDIDGYRYKRDVLFCYDLKLPEGFIPKNQDGEVESFKLIPVADVANVIRRTQFFKPNCNLVIIDFLFRHGYIRPEEFGYLKLLQSLRSGDCS